MNISDMMKQNPKVLFSEIKVIKKGRNNYYIDERTKPVPFEQMPKVKPIALNHRDVFIVCPYCQKIHCFPIRKVTKDKIQYCHCKGRLIFPGGTITDILEKQTPIEIDYDFKGVI